MESRCSVSGFSLLALKKVGEELTIDRIDCRKGYTKGNMRLLAGCLNRAKGVEDAVPRRAVNWLVRRMERVRKDRFTAEDAEILLT
jgi:hypothetical protein